MKKLLLSAACLLSAGMLSAQYYSLSFIDAGQNPGNLNNDPEQPLGVIQPLGWSEVLPSGSTDWSTMQSFPAGFDFDFNEGPVTSYHVAPSGVVTFAANPGTAPGSTNAALPSTMVPDSSIVAWGLNLSGGNDAVVSKTFGTAPNRQHWVVWASASATGIAGWAYWGIAFDEGTDKMHVVDMRTFSNTGGNVALTVGLQLDQANVWEIGSNVESGNTATGGNGSDASDNSYYSFYPGTQPAVEVDLTEIELTNYVSNSTPGTLSGKVVNAGSNAVSSWDVVWTDGTNTNTETFNTTIGASGGSATFTHSDQVSADAGTVKDITVYVVASNDADNSNDTLMTTVLGTSFTPVKAVFGEQGTGTWCQWCPRGHVYMDFMEDTHGESWVGVAVHNGSNDPMVVPVYDTWMGAQIGGYPSGLVGRDGGEYDPSQFPAVYDDQINDFGVANIYVDASKDENDLITVDMSAVFAITNPNADYRLAGIVVEDNLSGTGSGWAQANAYSGGGAGAMGGYENLPNPVPAADMVYDHVARELLGGIEGAAGSVPSNIAAGDSITHTYTIALDSDWDINELSIVALLLDNATGRVLNVRDDLTIDYSTEIDGELIEIIDGDTFQYWDGELVPFGLEETTIKDFAIYPNPANDIVNLQGVSGLANVSIFDAQGRMVSYLSTENNVVNVSELGAGFYTLVIENQGKLANAKLTILK